MISLIISVVIICTVSLSCAYPTYFSTTVVGYLAGISNELFPGKNS